MFRTLIRFSKVHIKIKSPYEKIKIVQETEQVRKKEIHHHHYGESTPIKNDNNNSEIQKLVIEVAKLLVKEWKENEGFRTSIRTFFSSIKETLYFPIFKQPKQQEQLEKETFIFLPSPKTLDIQVYELLGVSSNADDYEILGCRTHSEKTKSLAIRNYRLMVKKWHPDVNSHPLSGQVFQKLNESYNAILKKQ